ncbi:MAG TPA: zinc-dependent alcohol dehydrogenase family protein [Marmoricola sp.]|jgi:threonine dehydrogenase-like Zn-dependent dehydrogenase|nr:zinc-dependent alcohol dehydrogenase family protein [Marmoricola sp.]
MRVTTIHAAGDIRLEDRPVPEVRKPTDAVIKITAGCICGSDLWPYRGENPITAGSTIGHEMVGVVEDVGSEVTSFKAGDFVIVPFCTCDNTCPNCANGAHATCINGGFTTGGQGEYGLVGQAEGSLVATHAMPQDAMIPSLLSLSDVFPTGWHCAVCAEVKKGDTVVVVGDGAVGLCGVLAAVQMGAEKVIAMSRHESRQEIARQFGATHIVAERGAEGVQRIKDITHGIGADAVLECVGTDDAMQTAVKVARPGAMVGFVGVPHGVNLPIDRLFRTSVGIRGGVAPVRRYLPELLDLVMSGTVNPGLVFDSVMPLSEVAEGYKAMDERRAVKVLLHP